MSHVKPLSETTETVTLSRADYESMVEALEDAEDRMAILEDVLLDRQEGSDRHLLSMADTMRIIDGVSPVTVWRERRKLTVRQLADAVGMSSAALEEIEKHADIVPDNIAAVLDIPR